MSCRLSQSMALEAWGGREERGIEDGGNKCMPMGHLPFIDVWQKFSQYHEVITL